MTKKLKFAIVFRVYAVLIIAAPLISSVVGGCIFNHLYGWEGMEGVRMSWKENSVTES